MRGEFVCNLPGPADCPDLIACLGNLCAATEPRIFAEIDLKWPRHGSNYIGPAFHPSGGTPDPNDVAIYDVSNWPDLKDPYFADKVNEWTKLKMQYPGPRAWMPPEIPNEEL